MSQMVAFTDLPAGHNSANGFFAVRGAEHFIDFLVEVFGAEEVRHLRTPDRDGTLIHAEVRIGNATLMLADAKPDWPVFHALTQVYVADIREVLDRALGRGGRIVTAPTPFYGGVLIARLLDPWGNLWWLYQRQAKNADAAIADTSWHSREPGYVYTSLMAAMRDLADSHQ